MIQVGLALPSQTLRPKPQTPGHPSSPNSACIIVGVLLLLLGVSEMRALGDLRKVKGCTVEEDYGDDPN